MPPVTLPNLYTLPNDVFDMMSSEAVDMRLDDHNRSSGQTIQARANAVLGATSISIVALQWPMLAGTTIEFDGAGMPAVVQVVLSATAVQGATSLSVNPLSAQVNALAQAYDSGVNVALAARLVKACQYGTSRVKLYCCPRYNDSDLAKSWSVNRWATVAAAKWIAERVLRPCPESIQENWDETLEELKMVRVGMLNIEDIPTRTAGWPFISNITVDPTYTYRKLRVEPQLSEATPTQYAQMIDWNSLLLIEI